MANSTTPGNFGKAAGPRSAGWKAEALAVTPREVLVIARPGSATLRYRHVDDELTRAFGLARSVE